jgi:hypothetical protein
MNRFFKAVCLVSFALCAVMAIGSFSTASAYDGYHGNNRARYNRAYRHCSYKFPVGSHRFQRCMDYNFYRHGW